MSKKIIFSIWSDLTEEHKSVPQWKKDSLSQFKNDLINVQKKYADQCNADYFLFKAKSKNYIDVQFDKILKFEELTKTYDKVVYFDLDVIPITKKNIFNEFNFNYPCVYEYETDINNRDNKMMKRFLRKNLRENTVLDPMNRHSKVAAKKAMLLLDNISANNNICNTAVICGNSKASKSLNFKSRINMLNNKLKEAKEDNLYPKEFSKGWIKNNEIYFSYILERFNLKFNNIGIQWNYILDDSVTEFTDGAHLIHQVNKDFNATFSKIKSV